MPWHLEFARIYSIMSNQAHIDPDKDWHPQQHCFISTYAGEYKLAIYCVSNIPNRDEREQFIAYIRRFQTNYFKVIIAVKEGKRADFEDSLDEQTIEYIAACIVFIRFGSISGQYKDNAVLYYSGLSIPDPSAYSEVEPSANIWPTSLAFLLYIGFLGALYLVSSRLSLTFQEKSELILLTWYYACKESQIPDAVIFQQFSEDYAVAFKDYIQGKDLAELQNQFEKSREKYVGTKRKRL